MNHKAIFKKKNLRLDKNNWKHCSTCACPCVALWNLFPKGEEEEEDLGHAVFTEVAAS